MISDQLQNYPLECSKQEKGFSISAGKMAEWSACCVGLIDQSAGHMVSERNLKDCLPTVATLN